MLKEKYPIYFKNHVEINSVTAEENILNVREFIENEFEITPHFSSISNVNLLESKKTEFYKKFYHKKVNKKKETKSKKNITGKYVYFFEDFINLYNRQVLDNNVNKENFPYYSMTCVPFDTRIFISADNNLYHCEKVNSKNGLGTLKQNSNGNDYINFNEISEKTNKFIQRIMPLCSKCFNEDCPVCLHSEYNKGILKCDYFLSKKENVIKLQTQLINHFTKL